MAQVTALAAGTTAADSSDIVVTTPVTISLFSGETNGRFERQKIALYRKDGSNYTLYTKQQTSRGKRFPVYLSNVQRSLYLTDPGTYRLSRNACTLSVGIYVDNQT